MRERKGLAARRPGPEMLLWATLLFSYVFFFVCIKCIPTANTDGAAILRGVAALLALCMPALLYVRAEEGRLTFARKREKTSFWRILLFVSGAFFLGLFTATFAIGTMQYPNVFASFLLPKSFSFASFASLTVFAFASVAFPYGLCASFALSREYLGCFLFFPCLYAAVFFQTATVPLLLAFGLILALLYVQSYSFFSVFVANLFFFLGGYAVSVGALSYDRLGNLPAWAFLLITGVLALASLGAAIAYRVLRNACRTRRQPQRALFLRFALIPVAILLVSLLLSTLFSI